MNLREKLLARWRDELTMTGEDELVTALITILADQWESLEKIAMVHGTKYDHNGDGTIAHNCLTRTRARLKETGVEV